MSKNYFSKKSILTYLGNSLTGSMLGFLVGMWATSIVSKFFETRNIYNLWGLKAKKALISKETFENFEWVISIVIGFFVFEIFDKIVKERLNRVLPVYYQRALQYLKNNGYLEKAETLREQAGGALAKGKNYGKEKVKSTFNKYFGA